jgi:hypothetical protein
MPLRRSKSLFGTDKLSDTEGYLDPIALRKQNLVTSAMDDDDDDEAEAADDNLTSVGLLGGENPEGETNSASCKGGPFSALTPSMWPSKGRSFKSDLRSDQDHRLKKDLRSDQIFLKNDLDLKSRSFLSKLKKKCAPDF